MAIIKIKYKAASGSPPTGLTAGELAINLTDREMWVGGTSGAIIRLAGLSANTFTALNTFNAGISAASVRIGTGFITGACANAEMRMSANGDVSIISPTDIILGDSAPNYGANENSIEIQRSANSISVTTENFTIGRSGTSSTIKVGASGVTFDGLTATFNRFARFTSGLCASRAVLGSAAASDGVTIDGVLNCSQPVYFNSSISPGGGIYTQSTAFPYVSFPNAALEVAGSSFSVFFAGISASGITVSGRINLPTRPANTNDTTAATTAFVQTAVKDAITSGTVTSVNGKTGAFGISGGQGITTPKLDQFGNLVPAINYLNGGISITQKARFSEKDVLLFQEASTTNRDIYITSVRALKNYVLGLSGSGDTLIPPPGNALQSLSFIGLTQSGDTLTDYVVGFTALQSQVLIDAVTRYNGLTGSVQGVSALNGITGGITLNAGTNIGITFTRAGGITVSVSGLASSDNVVTSFNGLTGAVTGVTVGGANTFSTLQSFSAGISAAGATYSGLIRAYAGISVNGSATFGGSVTATTFTGNLSGNASTATSATSATTATNSTQLGGVAASSYARNDQTNTFTALQFLSAGISVNGSATFGGSVTATTFTGNLSGNASTATSATSATTATNSTQLGGVAAANYARNDQANTFSTLQSFSAGISAAGATYSGLIRAFAGISVNGSATFGGSVTATTFTGNLSGNASTATSATSATTATNSTQLGGVAASSYARNDQANTFSALQSFNAGVSIGTIGLISSQTLTVNSVSAGITNAGFLYVGGGATFNASIATNTITNTTPGTTFTVSTRANGATGSNINIVPVGSVIFAPTSALIVGGDFPRLVIQNNDNASGQVQISGGNLYLGTKTDGIASSSPSNIVFGNPTTAFTTTITAPNTATSNKTITLPNATGTVILDTSANTFTSLQSFSAGISAAGATFTALAAAYAGISVNGSATFGGSVTATTFTGNLSGNASTATSATSATNSTQLGGVAASSYARNDQANTFSTLQSFSAGISAAGATYSGLIRAFAGISVNGSATFGGSVTATTFTGNLSGNASTATSATSATNSTQLGGVAASSYARNDQANTFSTLQSFSAGISAAGATYSGLIRAFAGISINGSATFGGSVTATTFTGNLSGNASTATSATSATTATNSTQLGGVAASSYARNDQANTFSTLQSFSAGISAAGATYSGLIRAYAGISVNGSATFGGSVTATTFTGNLSGNASTATSATSATTATNSTQLGGVAASSYARNDQANTFSTLQSFSAGISASGGVTLASPNLVGTPIAPTATSGTNTTQIATTQFVRTEITNLINSAPAALDTLNELASALGNDANFSTTVTNSLANKAGTTGGGASGTWGINITGSAASATTATNSTQLGGVAASSYARNDQANTFSTLQSFSAGISSAGATFTALAAAYSGISVNGSATFGGSVTATTFTGNLSGNASTATSATSATTATNSTQLGGVAAANYARNDQANTFSTLQSFSAGISAAGATYSGLIRAFAGISVNGSATFGGSVTATTFTGNLSGNASTATSATSATTATNSTQLGGVAASNYARNDQANTFSTLQSFSAGISAAGATYSGLIRAYAGISVNGSATFGGSVTATTFTGNLSGNASTATSATSATTATNSTQLGGVAASNYARNDQTNTFTALQFLSAGISVNGSATFGGSVTATTFTGNLSGNASTATSATSATTATNSTQLGGVAASSYARNDQANTFSTLQSFSAGISAAGATYSGLIRAYAGISVNGSATFGGSVTATTFTGNLSGNASTATSATSATTATNSTQLGGVAASSYARNDQANTFSALQSFSAGISAAGATYSGLIRAYAGISVNGSATFGGSVTATTFTGNLSGNASTATSATSATTATNSTQLGGVAASSYARNDQANTFSALQSFSAGISAAGATYSGLIRAFAGISVNGSATFGGSVTATTFTGNLSGNASTATSATSATNSTQLGGVAASSYARNDQTNTFTALQFLSAGISVNGSATFGGSVTATTFTGNLSGNASTATNSTQLGGVAASSYARNDQANTFSTLQSFSAGISAAGATYSGLIRAYAGISVNGSATFGGSVTATTFTGNLSGNASTATNSTQLGGVAASSYARNDQANTFSALQSFSAGISAAGATYSGLIRAFAGISVNGSATFGGSVTATTFTGNLSGTASNASALGNTASSGWAQLAAANTFSALNTFSSGVKSNIYEPLTGGAGITFGLLSGGGQGNIHFLASEIRVGGTSTLQGITLTTVTGVTLTVRPRHNMIVSPINGEVTITNQGTALDLGTRPSILIQNDGTGNGQVRIAGGDLRIGTKFVSGGFSDSPCNIVFLNQDGVTTTITTTASGSNKTITLPNETGTVMLETKGNARGWFM